MRNAQCTINAHKKKNKKEKQLKINKQQNNNNNETKRQLNDQFCNLREN